MIRRVMFVFFFLPFPHVYGVGDFENKGGRNASIKGGRCVLLA